MLKFNSQHGFSLLELILSLGLLASICLSLQYSIRYFYQIGWQVSKQIELRQVVMQLGRKISKEIKRANFLADFSSEMKLSQAYFKNNCLLISYDFNRNGELSNTPTTSERIAYRWKQQRIEYAVVNMACQSDHWQSLIEEQQFLVTEFSLVKSMGNLLKFEFTVILRKRPTIKERYTDWISIQNGSW